MQDTFKDQAQGWDKGSTRVNGAKTIAEAIQKKISLDSSMNIMDFGVGTGLLGFEVAPKVKSILGIDTSQSMLQKLQDKNTPNLFITPCHQDIVQLPLTNTFDGIISSMTLHHVQDLKLFFETIYKNLNTKGFIAIADLESEDGTFHSNNEGVFHFGFDKKELYEVVESCGFINIKIENINTINKPHKNFGVFLLTASV